MNAVLERETVGRKKNAIGSKTLRVEEDVHELASRVAALEGMDVSAFLSALLRPILKEKLMEQARRIVESDRPPGKTPKK